MRAATLLFTLIFAARTLSGPVPEEPQLPSPEDNTVYRTFLAGTLEATPTPLSKRAPGESEYDPSPTDIKNFESVIPTTLDISPNAKATAPPSLVTAVRAVNPEDLVVVGDGKKLGRRWDGPVISDGCITCLSGQYFTRTGIRWYYRTTRISGAVQLTQWAGSLAYCAAIECGGLVWSTDWDGVFRPLMEARWVGHIFSEDGLLSG